jgi:hypothetical protein
MAEHESYAIVDRTARAYDVVMVLDTQPEAEEIAVQFRRKGREVDVREYHDTGVSS